MIRNCFALASIAFSLVAAPAAAQSTYPTRTISVVVPAAPGTTDTQIRLMTQPMSERMGQPIVVDNRPGAGTLLGTRYVASAKPDGHTLLYTTNSLTVLQAYFKAPGVDVRKDFAPITKTVESIQGIYTPSQSPFVSFKDFVTYAKANPGKLNYGSAGAGGLSHLAIESIKLAAGIEATHVPYRSGATLLTGAMANQVQVFSFGVSSAAPTRQAGHIRLLAVLSPKRSPLFPDVPAVAEFFPEIVVDNYSAVIAPKGTPRTIVDILYNEFKSALSQQEVVTSLAKQGFTIVASTPDELGRTLEQDVDKWTRVVAKAGIVQE